MRIAIDMDGVLGDFNAAFVTTIIAATGQDHFTGRMGPTFPEVWDYPQVYGYTDSQMKDVWKAIKRSPTFWMGEQPLPGAAEAINRLAAARDSGHDIYFITDRSGRLAKFQTEAWLLAHGFECPTVVMTPKKDLAADLLTLDVFIEDRLTNANAIIAMFRVMRNNGRVYLRSAPYNDRPLADPIEGTFMVGQPEATRDVALIIVNSISDMLDQEGL